MRRKFVYILWSILVGLVLSVVLFVAAVERGWIGYMPDLERIQNPINKFASQALTADGKLLGTWSTSENRIFVATDSISPYLFKALVASTPKRWDVPL